MLACPDISEFFSQSKIDDIDEMSGFICTHDEVCRLYISMNKIPSVNKFYTVDLGAKRAN
jgi:hypothetical protein